MNKETLKALRRSIRKWEKLAEGKGADKGMDNCPLCKMFPSCQECPVFEKTGYRDCVETPYISWGVHHVKKHRGGLITNLVPAKGCPECLTLAAKELFFLRSLLPKDGD